MRGPSSGTAPISRAVNNPLVLRTFFRMISLFPLSRSREGRALFRTQKSVALSVIPDLSGASPPGLTRRWVATHVRITFRYPPITTSAQVDKDQSRGCPQAIARKKGLIFCSLLGLFGLIFCPLVRPLSCQT